MPRVPPSTLPPPPPVAGPTPEETSLARREDLSHGSLSREELQEYLQDTLDPLSADERQWMSAYLENSGDWDAIAAQAGVTPLRVRNIMGRPRLRRALGRALGSQASPEMIVAGILDYAFGDTKVIEYGKDGSPKRLDTKSKLDALRDLAKLRGLMVDRLDVKGTLASEDELDQMLAAEMGRVRGLLPGSRSLEPVEVAPTEPVPLVDEAGEPPVDADLVDP